MFKLPVCRESGCADQLSCLKPMPEIFLSVIVLTRNREAEVVNCLSELVAQSACYDDVEIVVVDNASTDNTALTLNDFISTSKARISYVLEPSIGTSSARNRGRQAASGHVIAYIDDDEIPHPLWVARIREHFCEQMSDCIAGRIEVKPAEALPDWFPHSLMWVLGKSRFGDHDRFLIPPEGMHTGNFALLSKVFDAMNGFDVTFSYYSEEVDFHNRVNNAGFSTYYRNDIVVDHCISTVRLTKSALRKKAYLMGIGSAIVQNKGTSAKVRLRLVLLNLCKTGRIAAACLLNPRRFDREFTFFFTLGTLVQTISIHG